VSEEPASQTVTIAVAIEDPLLAERVVALLDGVAGVRVVAQRDRADVVLVSAANERSSTIDDESAATADARAAAALTTREREVLALLAEGASNKSIARRLGISVHTAKFHVGSLLDKLDATGRTDAVTHAARLGVIDL
jgi:DNA-binding CsgD family transcriptional regulator